MAPMKLRDVPRAERVPLELPARMTVDGRAYRALVVNLSVTGAFLEQASPIETGTPIELLLPLPGGEPVPVRAKVVRQGVCRKEAVRPGVDHLVVSVPGIGVAFEPLDGPTVDRLRAFLLRILDR